MSEKRTWTPKQEQCIHSHGGTLLVSAAAGSGKTSVLVERILQRITHPEHPVDIDRLLVSTFTRDAALEMKSRLAETLAKRLQEDPHNTRLQRQQMLLPRLFIGTMDSFCGELVRENFHALNISPRFRAVESEQVAPLCREALLETVTEFYEAADPDFLELASMLSDGKTDDVLMQSIEKIYRFLQSHPDPAEWLDRMSGIYDDSLPLLDTVWGTLALKNAASSLRGALQLCNSMIAFVEGDAELNDRYMTPLMNDRAFLCDALDRCGSTPWDEFYDFLRTHKYPSIPTFSDYIQNLRNKKMKALVTGAVTALGGTEAECLDDIRYSGRLVHTLYAMVRRFTVLFEDKKKAENTLEFSDVAHMAFELLTNKTEDGGRVPSALARELSERYDEILIDEYQDVNELQDAVFSALSRDESNMFFVGDVKQSIYAFRQAMPELFLRRLREYPTFGGENYPASILLSNNFRSREQVTEGVNFVFRQLMSSDFGGLDYGDEEALKATAKYEPQADCEPELLITETLTADGVKLGTYEADAIVVARRINEMVGTFPVRQKDGSSTPLKYSDCCILLRNRTHAADYRQALEALGIPVETDEKGVFFDTAEIRLALSLLRCIDNPLLDVSLTAWLLSPLCGFSPDDLTAIRDCRKKVPLYTALFAAKTQAPDAALRRRCGEALAFLQRYRTLSCQLTIDRLLDRLYDETALPELMSARRDGKRRRANLYALRDTCVQFEQHGFRGLSSFIRYIDRLQAQGIDLASGEMSDSTDAVRIKTIHHSKGLEFPVVFLSATHNEFNTDDSEATLVLHPDHGAGIKRRDPVTDKLCPTMPHSVVASAVFTRGYEEQLRLLYVAMTRAREKLFVTLGAHDPERLIANIAATLDDNDVLSPSALRSAATPAAWLIAAVLRHPSAAAWRHLVGRDDLHVVMNEFPWKVQICTPQPPTAEGAETTADTDVSDGINPTAVTELADGIRERIAYRYPFDDLAHTPAKMAASDTAHGALKRQFVATARPAFTGSGGLSPAERGTAMHTFMQYADFARAAADIESEAARLTARGFLTEAQTATLDRKKLARFFADDLYKRMCASPRCLREYPFTALHPVGDSEEHTVIQGIADCVFEEHGELVIVDYKTDRVTTPDELIERYRAQLDIYRQALGAVFGLPVRECVLYSFALGQTVTIPFA